MVEVASIHCFPTKTDLRAPPNGNDDRSAGSPILTRHDAKINCASQCITMLHAAPHSHSFWLPRSKSVAAVQ